MHKDLHETKKVGGCKGKKSLLSAQTIATIAVNTGHLIAGRGLTNVVRFVYAIVLARKLGPELYGLFNYGMSWYLVFIPFAGFGINIILSREVGRNRGDGRRVVGQTLLFRVGVTLVAAAASGIAGLICEANWQARTVLLVFSAALVGRSLSTWSDQVFAAYEANRYFLLQQTVFRPIEVVLGLVTLFSGGGLVAVTLVHAAIWWLQALYGMLRVHRSIVAIRLRGTWRDIRKIASQGAPIAAGLMLMNWLQQGPVVLYRHMSVHEASLGQFALAMQVFMILCYLPVAMGTAAFPVLSRAVARQDGKDIQFAETMVRAGLILGSVAGLVGISIGPRLIEVIFGPRFSEAGHVAGLAVWLLIPWTCGDTLSRLYFARGNFLLPAVCAGLGAAALTLSSPYLVTAYGSFGALIATGVGMGSWALILILLWAATGELDLSHAVYRPVAAVMVALLAFAGLKTQTVWVSLPAVLITLFAATLLLGALRAEERVSLLKFISKKPGSDRETNKQS